MLHDIAVLERKLEVERVDEDVQVDYKHMEKLPKERQLDDLIHSFHEIALISHADITSIRFDRYDEPLAEAKVEEGNEIDELLEWEKTDEETLIEGYRRRT